MSNIFVVDAGILFTNWHQKNPDAKMFTTVSVVEEVKNKPSYSRVENLVSLGRLTVTMPSNTAIKQVSKIAMDAGDKIALSSTDIELIALGLDLQESNPSITLVSTDLSLLNTAVHLGLKINDPSRRMQHSIRWILRCPGCGHKQQEGKGSRECPVCGTEMRRRPAERRKIHK